MHFKLTFKQKCQTILLFEMPGLGVLLHVWVGLFSFTQSWYGTQRQHGCDISGYCGHWA